MRYLRVSNARSFKLLSLIVFRQLSPGLPFLSPFIFRRNMEPCVMNGNRVPASFFAVKRFSNRQNRISNRFTVASVRFTTASAQKFQSSSGNLHPEMKNPSRAGMGPEV
jgi:hypothetical protein